MPRILSVHEEMKTFLSTLFIEGGVGSGMEGVVCQLWDDVSFHGTATGTRDAVYGEMLFSLLAGVTETDWFDLLGRGDAVGGGLMSRLNIIGTEGEYENVARMNPPDVTQLQETFLSRVLRLEDSHVKLATTKDADAVISQWADNLPEGSERMNVHAGEVSRCCWLGSGMRKLSQRRPRRMRCAWGRMQGISNEFYRVKAADTSNARVQAKILRALEMRGPMSRRKLQQHTNAHRDGTDLWSRALEGLLRDRSVGKQEDGTLYRAE